MISKRKPESMWNECHDDHNFLMTALVKSEVVEEPEGDQNN